MKYAVTGHRPNKLFPKSKFPYSVDNYAKLLAFAKESLKNADPKKVTILTGMALGWDMAIAEACCDLGIPFVAYVPCKGQESQWRPHWQAKYLALLASAQEVKVLAEKYSVSAMYNRNKAMADDADVLLALWDGTEGGTGHCVNYFITQYPDKKIYNYWNLWINGGK